MAAIQDGQQYVKVEDWPTLSGVWFWLQVFMLTQCFVIAIFVISGKWLPSKMADSM